jgi:hypothetical protein
MKSLNPQIRAFNAYKMKVDVLNEKLIQKIEALPENPRITRINENCYTISSKDFGTKNWTPFYHDFKYQYKFLRAIIENHDINQTERIFQDIMANGSYRLTKTIKTTDGHEFLSNQTYYFHPDVIAILKFNL